MLTPFRFVAWLVLILSGLYCIAHGYVLIGWSMLVASVVAGWQFPKTTTTGD